MAIYLSFLVPAIIHATPTNARPTPSAWNHAGGEGGGRTSGNECGISRH